MNLSQKPSRRFPSGLIDANWVTYPFPNQSQVKGSELPRSAGVVGALQSIAMTSIRTLGNHQPALRVYAAAAAVKSLQSRPTLCDPTEGSPPGSPVPGILQARTLKWVAIPFPPNA